MKFSQNSALAIVLFIITLGNLPVAKGDGRLTYGDKCSVSNAILQVFGSQSVTDNEKCNINQGLICTGTCTCPPTRVWYRGPFFGIFGGGSCIVGANGPCTNRDKCVDNAVCGDNVPLCFCMDGYYAHELQCISGSSPRINLSGGSSRFEAISFFPIILAAIIANKILSKFFKC